MRVCVCLVSSLQIHPDYPNLCHMSLFEWNNNLQTATLGQILTAVLMTEVDKTAP
jgi:hypothetical protein